ncbi:unnamed protein product [Boreogadus saida]
MLCSRVPSSLITFQGKPSNSDSCSAWVTNHALPGISPVHIQYFLSILGRIGVCDASIGSHEAVNITTQLPLPQCSRVRREGTVRQREEHDKMFPPAVD